MIGFKVLPRRFYERYPEVVAKELLGKMLVRRLTGDVLRGLIVETEAYFGEEDPASRAHRGSKSYNRLMWREPGVVFIYNVHKYWMFNIVAHEPGEVGAVLVRAVEPIEGIDAMRQNRGVLDLEKLTSGPGELALALKIDNRLNGASICSAKEGIMIVDNKMDFETASSLRIGVKKDLERELRFFIRRNRFVSK